MRTEADYKMAYDLGVLDGVESPHDLSMGMTWDDDQDMNEAYDRGVNDGQAVALARQLAP